MSMRKVIFTAIKEKFYKFFQDDGHTEENTKFLDEEMVEEKLREEIEEEL